MNDNYLLKLMGLRTDDEIVVAIVYEDPDEKPTSYDVEPLEVLCD